MATIHEEVIVIKLSKLVKESDSNTTSISSDKDFLPNLETIVQEMIGPGVLVEIEQV